MNITWEKPYYAILFLLILGVIWLFIQLNIWRKKVRTAFADESLQEDIFGKTTTSWLSFKNIFLIMALIFSVIALMGPKWGEEEQRLKREGIDIAFALDLSNSMNAEDIAPSRLEKAKNFILQYVNTLGGDRVGLIVFAGDAYAVSPLTSDYSAITSFVEGLNTTLLWDQGTDFSQAIQEGVKVLGDSPETSKALILISDGEDHEEGIAKEIDFAKENKVEIFTIGVGNATPVPIPMVSADGFDEGYKEDDNGTTVLTSFHGEQLRYIAKKSDGSYIKLDNIKSALNSLKSGLNNLEKKSESEISSFNKKEQFQWFLAIAILFFFIYTLTPDNKFIKR